MTITQIHCMQNQLTNEGKVLSNFQHWEYKFAFKRAEERTFWGILLTKTAIFLVGT